MLVVPVYNKLVLPNTTIYFQSEEFRRLAGRGYSLEEKIVLLVQKEDKARELLDDHSFYEIGAAGVISEISQEGYVAVRTLNRVNVDMAAVNRDHTIDLTISRRADVQDLDETESYEKAQALKREMLEFVSNFQWGNSVRPMIERLDGVAAMATAVSPWLKLSNEEHYAALKEDSVAARTAMLEQLLYEFMEVAKVTNEAATSQQKEYQDMYRESAIKKQMKYLQKELDEMHPENVSDLQRFEQKIAESGMNETARKEAEKVLNRLKQEGAQSAETGMLYDYLDFVTGLSWKKEEARFIELDAAERILEEDHYGLKKVKQRIIQQIAVMNLKRKQSGSILLFVGAPGTGKTSIGRSIAKALGREYVRVSLGGVRDEADIRGHRRTYIGAMPGRIMDGIEKSGVSNPVMVLDEVDKLSNSYHGDPASALLEVLDPEQNNTFTDHYMNVPYDLSDVMFICTANTTDTIPEPLLNRMEVISFTGYTPDEKLKIAREHLLPKAMEAMGIAEGQLVISDETIAQIIADYTMEAGVRGLRKRMDTLCRTAAVRLARTAAQDAGEATAEGGERDAENAPGAAESGEKRGQGTAEGGEQKAENAPGAVRNGGSANREKVEITPADIRETLDMSPMHHNRVLSHPKPGVVTGLAWTSVGGKILYIETILTKGEGKLLITGQLGDVMKESAQIAVSLVKSMFPEKADLFKENDLHIHVPEGAVPKDGPSAGVTLTTAIASLVAGRPVDPKIAMTGEVSLRGAVTPIGGLPEKLLAAERAGVTKALIPRENVEDLKDVAQEVKEKLTIVPVDTVEDVLRETGLCYGITYESGCCETISA